MTEITKNKMNNSEIKETTTVNEAQTPTTSTEKEVQTTALVPTTTTEENKEEEVTIENTSAEEKKEETKSEEKAEEKKDEINLKNLDVDFAYDLMSVPTYSYEEYRMVSYLILWARRKGVKYEFDEYGNVYLTKGELAEGEFYPCVTSHLDTVQQKQKAYAQAGMPLEIKTRVVTTTKKHEMYVEGMGIGADCKTGVLISLSLFDHFDKIKGAFFLEEEVGMNGSKHMNTKWFDNVGYVVGWDSPDLNRAAYSCSGTLLMSKDFFENNIKEICKKHGLTNFKAEPFTDVCNIREKTKLMCMNFGNGGYLAHSATEYMVLEDTDHALTMGIELIENLGNKQYKFEPKVGTRGWVKTASGQQIYQNGESEDEKFFRTLGYSSYGGYAGGYNGGYGSYDDDDYWARYNSGSTRNSGSTTHNSSTTANNSVNKVDEEAVSYITDRYEEHIADIKTSIEAKCKELGVDFAQFSEIFETKIKF